MESEAGPGVEGEPAPNVEAAGRLEGLLQRVGLGETETGSLLTSDNACALDTNTPKNKSLQCSSQAFYTPPLQMTVEARQLSRPAHRSPKTEAFRKSSALPGKVACSGRIWERDSSGMLLCRSIPPAWAEAAREKNNLTSLRPQSPGRSCN